jgi:hypothetical protein
VRDQVSHPYKFHTVYISIKMPTFRWSLLLPLQFRIRIKTQDQL